MCFFRICSLVLRFNSRIIISLIIMKGTLRGRNQRKQASYVLTEYSGPSYMDLPKDVLVKILLKLSVMSIFVCKAVCKAWYDMLSEHSFAQLYFNQAEICPILRRSENTFQSRLLYLVQTDQSDFERKLDMCDLECFGGIEVKLDAKLKIPVRNMENILFRKDGEFVDLPKSEVLKRPIIMINGVSCGLGYSSKTNQYKVIRMYTFMVKEGNENVKSVLVAQVNVLGTNTWKDIGSHPYESHMRFTTYSNGCNFWLTDQSVVIFDVENECFKSISLPRTLNLNCKEGMGVLGGDICVTYQCGDDISVWVMKDFSDDGAYWRKAFSTNLLTGVGQWPQGAYRPLKYLNNGAILMFHSLTNAFIYKDLRKLGYKYLKVRGVEGNLEAIPHIPSFISLKEILSVSDIQVLNVKTRCAKLNLHDESSAVSIVNEEFHYQ